LPKADFHHVTPIRDNGGLMTAAAPQFDADAWRLSVAPMMDWTGEMS